MLGFISKLTGVVYRQLLDRIERQRAETSLATTARRLQLVVDALPIALLSLDPSTRRISSPRAPACVSSASIPPPASAPSPTRPSPASPPSATPSSGPPPATSWPSSSPWASASSRSRPPPTAAAS
ncbi:hypothetical protein [Nannocystis pusilla]|uniref:hypothetical protein n=1 Tax=Nannocystis pusilla TaxID=889268 RepID=UPI003B7A822A